ncbi:MTAP family purine nucleoside phosphorylase [Candidatus Methanocrinis natronophilus]|uniref:Probable S-methyl-5'-thioinosine phosphorylase n=1 Tax=Candidatus Methanocrinis natronophilus TaxID=3033396 RepID=A0ABT5X592_9EURY|nr:MTAP family purine nucleoside phosphorylase [Candidatus Methanocrinis natronophilus]MDF0589861.1 MTAP family purine nucleoside phosphorylase [Candidatus Methanocrinis natronophilus]
MDSKVAVIGGTGVEMVGEAIGIDTPFGWVEAKDGEVAGDGLLFIPRHGEVHLPPHRVNYRALLWAAKAWGARRVISTNTVGSMSWHPVGSYVIPDDFVDFTKSRASTFFEEEAVHVDLTAPYCPEVRRVLVDGAKAASGLVSGGVYVCTEGPHLESPAQIRMLRRFGDVVGMTGYPEVVLARELELCYASICIVTNPAAGMRKDSMSAAEITAEMERSSGLLMEIIAAAASKIPEERGCSCGRALAEARL